ncbi:O-antigen ligase family protein [Halalkalicoccus ordinarius]|uniref:O-antigen ligase family protein n=1 Tax=Halalkalicoccus ordinarius TaxID=3116651 RepID=UPI00300F38F5
MALGYGVLVGVPVRTDRVFLGLFGLYWLLLAGNYLVTRTEPLLLYVLVTPIAVGATVVVLPEFIEDDRMLFTKLIVVLSVVLTIIGVAMLAMETRTEQELFTYVGDSVLGYEGYRIISLFDYWNTYGFMMMVGFLSTLYVYLEERRPVWALCLVVVFVGLVLSDGDASYVGVGAGGLVLVAGYSLYALAGFLILGAFGAGAMLWTGQLQTLLESGLTGRVLLWEASIRRLQDDPYVGIGFKDNAAEIYPYSDWPNPAGTHNSYIHILLNTGVIAGTVYLLALGYGALRSFWIVSSTWDLYVVGTLTAILVHMCFESVTLGGLSMTSVFLGLYLGLGLRN